MIWGIEGRHLWVPPGLADLFTPAQFAAGTYDSSLYDYIRSLGPSLYWPLDALHGATDQSGNGRNGTAQGGITIGGAAGLTAITGDSATDFDGADDYITSSYSPFVNGTDRTVIGLASRDASASVDTLFGGQGFTSSPRVILQTSQQMHAYFDQTQSASTKAEWQWPGNGIAVPWAVVMREGANSIEPFLQGASLTASTNAVPYSSPGAFELGVSADNTAGSLAFDGKMSHVAVFERALTAQEIAVISSLAISPIVAPLPLNRRLDDAGEPIYPQHHVQHISGLGSTGDSADRRDVRVGAQGEIPRRSYRRGKTVTYEGLNQALARDDLRQMEEHLTAAFDDQTAEGLMVVTPHPLYDASGDFRYFRARALAAESDDAATFSPGRYTHGHESPFVVAVRNARAGGVSYYDQDGNAYP